MKRFLKRNIVISAVVIIGIVILSALDLVEDYRSGDSMISLIYETSVFGLAVFGICVLLNRNYLLKSEIQGVVSQLAETHENAQKWKAEHSSLLKGLGHAIDIQLNNWSLSTTEKEIALFLLKGMSFKEISEIRGTTEKTVRQQALKVYEKANLNGRTELSAFFLEDLLQPLESNNQLNQ